MVDFEVRTDLAVEEQEHASGEISGVSLREWREADSGIKLSEVRILNKRGSEAMGKPQGTYLTLELTPLTDSAPACQSLAARSLARQIRKLARQISADHRLTSVLVTGLGNRLVTADSLGPETVDNLQVTHHLTKPLSAGTASGSSACGQLSDCPKRPHAALPSLRALSPGVMAQTGMETAQILRGVIRETRPDLLIVIDALAARSITRLGTTIQLTDTGIRPGSGVGNHRHELTRESLGLPVLAIGVPTVVGAVAIVHDTVNAFLRALERSAAPIAAAMNAMDSDEQYELIRELMEPEFATLYVTPPNIDEIVGLVSHVVAEGIQQALFHG